MRLFVLIFTIIMFNFDSFGQDISFQWANSIGGSTRESSKAVLMDTSGNIYCTGYFSGTVDFDPGSGVNNLTSLNGNTFITKFAADGSLIWAKQFEGGAFDEGNYLGIDQLGNVYIGGYFNQGTTDFDPGTGVTNLTATDREIYVVKLKSNGDFVWAIDFAGSSNYIYSEFSMHVDSDGNVYSSGYFDGTRDFDPSSSTMNLVSNGANDSYVCKLDKDGILSWAKSFGGSQEDVGFSVTTDASGNVYSTGFFEGTVDFDPGSGTTNMTSPGQREAFISKLDLNGNLVWAKHVGGVNGISGKVIKVDLEGNICVTGGFTEKADFDPGIGTFELTSPTYSNPFLLKLDSDGDFIWANHLVNGIGDNMCYSMVIDKDNNICLSGYFFSSSDFDPGSGKKELTSYGNVDAFILKIDKDGDYVWAYQMGGTFSDKGFGIATGGAGEVVVTGHYDGTADFDPSTGVKNFTSAGDQDIFITKIIDLTVDTSSTTTRIAEHDPKMYITVYPNPSSGDIYINSSSGADGMRIEIFNYSGKIIQKESGIQVKQPISINSKQGIYFIKVYSNNEMVGISKIIKTQ